MYVCTAFIDITNSDWIKKWTCIKVCQKKFLKSKEPLMIWRTRKTNQVVIWHKVSTLFWMKRQVYLLSTPTWSFLFRLNQRNVTWIFMQLCARHIAKLCIEYYVPMYIWKKFFEFMMGFFFFFRFEFKLLWNSDFMLLSYSEIIIGIFPFKILKKKNLATSS